MAHHSGCVLLVVASALMLAVQSSSASGVLGGVAHEGFYVPSAQSKFFQLAAQSGTDKVTAHRYEALYSKYFELIPRHHPIKIFEIGLGCNYQHTSPASSMVLWRSLLPHAEIWVAEYDGECVANSAEKFRELRINSVVGDQANFTILDEWVQQTGGNFDVIVDDGGHNSIQQYNSFMTLFSKALKPGGLYFIEDLQVSRYHNAYPNKYNPMIDIIKDWIEIMVGSVSLGDKLGDENEHWKNVQQGDSYIPKHRIPPRIRSIECSQEICSFTKCFDNDARCDYFMQL